MRDVPLSTYSIVAPFDGTILDREMIVPGVAVDPTHRIFTMANLSTVWVEASVHESDFDKLAEGPRGKVRFRSPAYPGREFTGGWSTRRPRRREEPERQAPRRGGEPRDGCSSRGCSSRSRSAAPATVTPHACPTAAAADRGGGTFVFVRTGPERFDRREVVAGGHAAGRDASVRRGLDARRGGRRRRGHPSWQVGPGRRLGLRAPGRSADVRFAHQASCSGAAGSSSWSWSRWPARGPIRCLHLPIDAVPDITNVQVMALTSAPALGPEEVEQFITIPVENAMNGIPRIKEVRSFSQFGISGVTIIFEDGTDIYWARQQVGERLDQVRSSIPEEFGQPEMGPIATGPGRDLPVRGPQRPRQPAARAR